MVEENIKKVEREAQDLNDNYRFREHDGFKKLREFTEMEFEVNAKNEAVRQLELQNKRLREDIAVLENELAKAKHAHLETKALFTQEREQLQLAMQKLAN
jgi:predicted  nucleic acid-binding Zn-ribbon protein